ncbi:DUF5368 domain-containing protein [Roseospira visakhapatnamensis]|uniref:Uncharacterized protein n=1 Tax=Roseospira visakhapatnamensis TaxID=390880 RepID=A0A7W6W8X2_9PROT|nr:DUF5368 domain-containing protein [Roseospira visakhapatnamensis]MBB4264861.1 hypothetical protein [Roseospira visakhapatnamensis]
MQGFDIAVFVSVFLEMMGGILWVLLALAVMGIAGFVMVLLRERTLVSRRLLRCQAMGLLGGVGALVLMAWVTMSGFTDAGGPVDWLLIGIIFGTGLMGTTILTYAAWGLIDVMTGRSPASARAPHVA